MQPTPLPATTNAQDWAVTMNVYDSTADTGFDLDLYTATVRINAANGGQLLSATATKSDDADAITSVLSWTFTAAQMATLSPGSYTVAVRIVSSTSTRQILLGKLPVVSGGFE